MFGPTLRRAVKPGSSYVCPSCDVRRYYHGAPSRRSPSSLIDLFLGAAKSKTIRHGLPGPQDTTINPLGRQYDDKVDSAGKEIGSHTKPFATGAHDESAGVHPVRLSDGESEVLTANPSKLTRILHILFPKQASSIRKVDTQKSNGPARPQNDAGRKIFKRKMGPPSRTIFNPGRRILERRTPYLDGTERVIFSDWSERLATPTRQQSPPVEVNSAIPWRNVQEAGPLGSASLVGPNRRHRISPYERRPVGPTATGGIRISRSGVTVEFAVETPAIASQGGGKAGGAAMRQTQSCLFNEVEGHNKLPESLKMVQKAKQVRLTKNAKKIEESEEFADEKGADATPPDPADNVCVVNARELEIRPIYPSIQPKVPNLSHGLDRVLFNPGVYHLQDPRSKVYNFDPYLQKIMEVSEFDFDALKAYTTSSRDQSLKEIATALGKKYVGSSSSMTSALGHFHFLLSQWRPVNADALTQGFPETLRSFTILQRKPSAILLRYRDGGYAIDADKEFDTANILSMLGKSMEKLLTLPTDDFERYRRSSEGVVTEEERTAPEAFHYCSSGDFLMRSQLDAQDPRLPGTGIFDVKTRAVVSIRMDAQNYEEGRGYEIKDRHGEWESFEREYFDMIRAAFLKYSLQVRMGRMDGIFVAFHNTQRIFGFQYISLPEMDSTIHGDWNTTLGDQEFKISLEMLNQVLNRATAKYPEQTLRIHFETRETKTPFMYIFVEPVTEAQADEIQTRNREQVEEFERKVLGRGVTLDDGQLHVEVDEPLAGWEDIRATVEDELTNDELAPNAQADVAAEDLTNANIPSDGPYPDEITELGVRDNIAAAPKILDRVTAGRELLQTADGRHTSDVENVALGTPSIDDETEVDSVAKSGVSAIPGKVDEDSRTGADLRFLDTVESEHLEAQAREDVLAMTLTIRNKVNGAYVVRPENLTGADEWSVEYSLDEISPDSRARNLYHACQQRRRKAFEATEFEDEDVENNHYIQRLRDMSRAGQIWRAEQDRAHPTQVFYGDPKPTSASDADSAMSSSDKRSGSGKKKLKKKKHDG